jgi:hypothetical protein
LDRRRRILLGLVQTLLGIGCRAVHDAGKRGAHDGESLGVIGGERDFLVTDGFHLINLADAKVTANENGVDFRTITALGILLQELFAELVFLGYVGNRGGAEGLDGGVFLGVHRRGSVVESKRRHFRGIFLFFIWIQLRRGMPGGMCGDVVCRG